MGTAPELDPANFESYKQRLLEARAIMEQAYGLKADVAAGKSVSGRCGRSDVVASLWRTRQVPRDFNEALGVVLGGTF